MDVTIRPYRPGDGEALSDVQYRSIREGALAGYSAAQVAAWLPEPTPAWRFDERAADGRVLLVAVASDGGRPVAYGDLEADGHVDHLFCAPEAIGRGVAAALIDAVVAIAVDRGLERLFVEASELARPAFLRKGFVDDGRRDFEVRGVDIHNYAMHKVLGAARPLVAPGDEGGDPACWLDQVCDRCGAFVGDQLGHDCPEVAAQ